MKKLKTFLLIFILLLLLGSVFVLSYFMNKIPENPTGTIGNTGGNLYNNGLFCENDGQVFFANPYDQNTLYVMNPNETEVKKLTTVGVKSINAAGKFIYYYQDDVGDGSGLGYTVKTTGMYRMKKDGNNPECLIREPMLTMNLIDNKIYFQHFNDEGGLNLDYVAIDKSSEGTALEGIMSPASAMDGSIYYAHQEDNFLLYTYNTRTNMNSVLWNHKVYNPIYHTDGYIYFMDVENNYRICRYNPSSGESQIVTYDRVENFNVYNNYIYYQKFSQTEPALMRVQTDGFNPEVVMYGNFGSINITSTYVYYTEYGTTTPVYHQSLYGPINPTVFTPQKSK